MLRLHLFQPTHETIRERFHDAEPDLRNQYYELCNAEFSGTVERMLRMQTLYATDLLPRQRVLSLQTEIAHGKNSRNRSTIGSGRRPVANQISSFISASRG